MLRSYRVLSGALLLVIAAAAWFSVRPVDGSVAEMRTEVAAAAPVGDAGEYMAQGVCRLGGTLTDANGQPVAGASILVRETLLTTRSDANGNYTISVPGPGVWTVSAAKAGFAPMEMRLEVGPGCVIVGQGTADEAAAQVEQAPAVEQPAVAVRGAHRFTGAVTIDGEAAPRGVTAVAYIDGRECARVRLDQAGRYALTVPDAATVAGCGAPGATVQFSVLPAFGSGWRLAGSHAWRADGDSRVDLMVDLNAQAADGENVPLFPRVWQNPTEILIAPCGQVSAEVRAAAAAAVAMWTDAAARLNLGVRLRASADACRGDVPAIVVGEVAWADRPEVVGSQQSISVGRGCQSRGGPVCDIQRSFVSINTATRARGEVLWARAMAHEIGHALGLDHAAVCNGGTLMYADAVCRFPEVHVGVDDVAALQQRYPGDGTVASTAAVEFDAAAVLEAWSGTERAPGFAAQLAAEGLDLSSLLRNAEAFSE